MSTRDAILSRWLDAHHDGSASLRTLSQLLALCDVSGSGEHRLVAVQLSADDVRPRLRIYRGTTLVSDQPLPEIPSGVVGFYTDNHEPRVPSIAVACGSDVLLYKNTKPFYKFSLPNLPVNPVELDVWKKLPDVQQIRDLDDLLETLRGLTYQELTPRSQVLLTLPPEQREEFIGRYGYSEPKRISTITALTTLNKNSTNKDAVACPVLVTESGSVFILDPQGFSVLHQANVGQRPAPPSHVACTGMYDVEFRIVICCRDGGLWLLKKSWLEGRLLLMMPELIIDMAVLPVDGSILLAQQNGVQCYSKKGKKSWSLTTSKPISCLGLVPLPHLTTTLIAVGLRGTGGGLQLYQGRKLVDTISTGGDIVSAIRFGQLGQEEHVLVVVTHSGSLLFKILKRTADFSTSSPQDSNNSSSISVKPLPLPKRSKLFEEQAQRERQDAQAMHRSFQQDLIRLRLTSGRAVVQALQSSDQNVMMKQTLKVSAQVLGLGPKFTLILTLENTDQEKAAENLSIVLHAKLQRYKITKPYSPVPTIPPGLSFKVETSVQEDVPEAEADATEAVPIRVLVISEGRAQPVLAALINMPPTDPLAFM